MAWRRLILHNLWMKIFSVLLAMLIWFVINANISTNPLPANAFARIGTPRDFPEQPVWLLSVPDDGRSFRVDPETVTVRVSGPVGIVDQLTPNDVRVFARVPPTMTTNEAVPLKAHAPPGITIVEVTPAAAVIHVRPGARLR